MEKRLGFLFALVLLSLSILAQSQSHFRNFVEDPSLENAKMGMSFIYLDTEESIFSYQSDKPIVPASSQKLLVTTTALAYFGPDFQFQTTIEYSGVISENGVLKGDILIRGGGDPTLGSAQMPHTRSLDDILSLFANRIKDFGIRRIEGSVIVDASLYGKEAVPKGWSTLDVGNYYGAGAWSLNIHDNLYFLDFERSSSPNVRTKVIKTRPEIPSMRFNNQVETAGPRSGDNAYIYGGAYVSNKTIKGSIPSGKGVFTIKGSLPNPPLLFGQLLTEELSSHGIHCLKSPFVLYDTAESGYGYTIFTYRSHKLSKILEYTNQESVNMYCESMLKALGAYFGGGGTYEEGIIVQKSFMDSLGIDISKIQIADASGLSRKNELTADVLVKILGYSLSGNKEENNVIYNSLAVCGQRGTLSKVFDACPKGMNLRGKTGSMRGIRSLTGTFFDKNNREILFSIMVNDYNCSGSQMWKKMENLLKNLYYSL